MKRFLILLLLFNICTLIFSAESIVSFRRVFDFGLINYYPVDSEGGMDYGFYEYTSYISGGGYNYTIRTHEVVDKTSSPYYGRVDANKILYFIRQNEDFISWGLGTILSGGIATLLIPGVPLLVHGDSGYYATDEEETMYYAGLFLTVFGGIFGLCFLIFGVVTIVYAVVIKGLEVQLLRSINGLSSSMDSQVRWGVILDSDNEKSTVGLSLSF